MAITLYLEGCGFRRISRILSEMFDKFFRWQTVVQWIKKASLEMEKNGLVRGQESEEIPLLEMDELYAYIKKKIG